MAERILAKDFSRALRRRLNLDTEIVKRAALETVARGEADAVTTTKADGLVDQGQYLASWKHAPIREGAELRNDSPHASTIEWGRRPGRPGPPYEPILRWVERKLVGNGTLEPNRAAGIAWVIRNKIHREGSPPHNILRTTFEKMKPWFLQAAERELRRNTARGR